MNGYQIGTAAASLAASYEFYFGKENHMKRKIRKPFSELSRAEKIAEAHAAIARLSHPHNYGSRECYAAIQRWRKTLEELDAC